MSYIFIILLVVGLIFLYYFFLSKKSIERFIEKHTIYNIKDERKTLNNVTKFYNKHRTSFIIFYKGYDILPLYKITSSLLIFSLNDEKSICIFNPKTNLSNAGLHFLHFCYLYQKIFIDILINKYYEFYYTSDTFKTKERKEIYHIIINPDKCSESNINVKNSTRVYNNIQYFFQTIEREML